MKSNSSIKNFLFLLMNKLNKTHITTQSHILMKNLFLQV
jgi:hypothetical protein